MLEIRWPVVKLLNKISRNTIRYSVTAITSRFHRGDPVSYTHLDVYKRQGQISFRTNGSASHAFEYGYSVVKSGI